MKFPGIKYCESMSNLDANPIFKEVLKILYRTNPDLVVDCPTTKVIFNNTVLRIDTLPSIFPRGDYKCSFKITELKSMKEIMTIEAIFTIISSEMNTFG